MANRNLQKDLKETQKLVKDAAVSMRKAADRAARVAKQTGTQIGKSKEYKDARKEARLAIKAIGATAKVALAAVTAAGKALGDSKEVKKATRTTKAAARGAAKTTRTAGNAARKSAKTAARSTKSKVGAKAKAKVKRK